MRVTIDGTEYIPRAEIPPLTDERLKACLQELTSIFYFDCKIKNKAWDAMNALSPELAELAANDPAAAYDRLHDDETEQTP